MITFIERTPATRETYIKASAIYLGFMTLWLYAFANSSREVPGLVVFVALLAAMAVHFGVGLAVPRQETYALLAYAPLLAVLSPVLDNALWVPLVFLMVFPGAPLMLLGIWLRKRIEEPQVDDSWY